MLYEDDQVVDSLRQKDPNGLYSNNDLRRAALRIKLENEIENVQDEHLRNILETLLSMIK